MACPCRNVLRTAFLRPFAARPILLQTPLPIRSISTTLPRLSEPPNADSLTPPAPSSPSTTSPSPAAAATSTPSTSSTPPNNPKPKRKKKKHLPLPPKPEPTPSEPWRVQKAALTQKFPLGWSPPKRLSPDCLSGMRALHAQFPDVYDTPALANLFGVSPEAVRRILKGKWTPRTDEEEENRRQRWLRRGVRVWERYADLGLKVPSRWRREGVRRRGARVGGAGGKGDEGVEGVEEVLGGVEGDETAMVGEEGKQAEAERRVLDEVKLRRRIAGKIM